MKSSDLFSVRGLITVVTGGASGIGYALADVMADNGAIVAVIDRDTAAMNAAVGKLREKGEVHGETADVTDKAGLARAFDAVAARHGRIDVVFANAGISGGPGYLDSQRKRDPGRAIEAIPDDLWTRVIATNLTACFNTIQVATPHLKRAGGGRIVVTSSISATKTEQFVGTTYVVSKAGVAQLVRQSALELAAHNIRVNAIAPGPCITNIGGGRLQDKAAQDFFGRQHPTGRMARPEDMQGAAIYLASNASSHVTGAQIVIDGGITLGSPDQVV
jgi:NAD(P)-dependent dehydrogenase (short-subunit alcohol dehydrogenase family)